MGTFQKVVARHDGNVKTSGEDGSPLRDWSFDGDAVPYFDPSTGSFAAPRDGLYSVRVDVGPADIQKSSKRSRSGRKNVKYYVRVCEPKFAQQADNDEIDEELMDVGFSSFGEVLHLRKDATITIIALPTLEAIPLSFQVDLIQRKRKREPKPELTAKELKKLQKKKRKLEARESERNLSSADKTEAGLKNSLTTLGDMLDRTDNEGRTVKKDTCDAPDSDLDENEQDWSAGFSSDDSAAEDERDESISRPSKKLRASKP